METDGDGDGDPIEKGHSKMSHLPNWLAQTFSRPQCAIKFCVHSSKLILRRGMMSCANAITLFPTPHLTSPSSTHSSTGCVWSGWGRHWKPGEEAGHAGGSSLGKCRSPDQIDFLASLGVCLTFYGLFIPFAFACWLFMDLLLIWNSSRGDVRGRVAKCLSNKYICLILFSPPFFATNICVWKMAYLSLILPIWRMESSEFRATRAIN